MSEAPPIDDRDSAQVLDREEEDSDSAVHELNWHRRYRWIVWAIGITIFLGYVGVARVHTRLGVEAFSWDKNGREYVWRVWWRARYDIVDMGPDRAFMLIYVGLAFVFVALSALACWIALVPDEPTSLEPVPQAGDSI